jgi:hypothetical protein
MKQTMVFVVAAVAATALVAGASAGGDTAAGGSVTTTSSIHRYLATLGIDSRAVVVQRGQRNYAGPRCPGKAWTCTNASRVVQISSHRGSNRFECSPASAGTNPEANTCVIVQASTTGTNVATCSMRDSGTTVAQSCAITQTNQQGTNKATVELFARTRGGSTQDARQTVDVQQTNASGRNYLRSVQRIEGSVGGFGTVQAQEGHQTLDADQTSSTGSNDVRVEQLQSLLAKAFVRNGLVQRQNAVDAGPNLDADVTQTAVSGRNSSVLKQRARYKALAKSKAGPVEQRQGSPTGGLRGNIDQTSASPSTSINFQDETLKARAKTHGALTQVQFGPSECCTEQLGSANNVFVISQRSRLISDGGEQTSRISGSCITSGRCKVDQVQRTDDDAERNRESCQGSVEHPCAVFTGIVCFPGAGCSLTDDEGEGSGSARARRGVARR